MLGLCCAFPYSDKHSMPLLVVKENRLRERLTGLTQATTIACTIMCNLLNGLLTLLIGELATRVVLGIASLLTMSLYEAQVKLRRLT
jgi:hypothetical protein